MKLQIWPMVGNGIFFGKTCPQSNYNLRCWLHSLQFQRILDVKSIVAAPAEEQFSCKFGPW